MSIKNLYISIPSVWAVRNFIYSEVVKKLKEKYNVILIIPEQCDFLEIARDTGCGIIEYPILNKHTYFKLFKRSLNLKLIRKTKKLKESELISKSLDIANSLNGRLIRLISNVLSVILINEVLFNLYLKMGSNMIFKHVRNQIKVSSDSCILATNIVVSHEQILFINLRKLKIFKIDFINSFDNTTSRGFVPFRLFDLHLVWNSRMKQELIDVYGVRSSNVDAIGTPQFDLLVEAAQTALDESDELYELVEEKDYILYCAGHYSLLPFEVNLVYELLGELNKRHKNLNFIVRLHPLDDYRRWNITDNLPSNVKIDRPWIQNSSNPLLSSSTGKYGVMRHGRILGNAKLILNIASTSSLDACVLNKPVYNLYLKKYNKNRELDGYYNSEHFKPIIESGAAPLLESIDAVDEIISFGLDDNDKIVNQQNRKMVSEKYCGYSPSTTFLDRFSKYLSGKFQE